MTEPSADQAGSASLREHYTHGYADEWQQVHGGRTLAAHARFMIPHLRAGLRVIDCGCGPGSITCDIAQAVVPGEVVGIDIAEAQLDRARRLAVRRGIPNVRFERGDIYALPFPDGSFDVALAHNVLHHLGDPPRAIREMRRVLKPSGIIGIHDPDFSTWLVEPRPASGWVELFCRVLEFNGASLWYARSLRRLLREAGFARTEGFAEVEYFGNHQSLRIAAVAEIQQFRDPAFVATALDQGWADRAQLDAMIAELEAWAENPDAYEAYLAPCAIGWLDGNGGASVT
jgi:ubiquinone/menaquinone biosynthesis C-methylase UbiE